MLSSLAISGAGVESFDFRFSSGVLTPNDILDSATTPPGRYVWEVARRTLAACPDADAVVVANPILPIRGSRLVKLALAGGPLPCPAVLTDEGTFPIAYILPRRLLEEGLGRFLCLLSVSRSAADAQLLSRLTGGGFVPRRPTPLRAIGTLPESTPQGYVLGDNLEAWLVQCVNAVTLMRKRDDWRDLPFAAHHPGHAGDVLFFSLASRLVGDEHLAFQSQVVCRAYLDIFHDCGNRLAPIVLDIPPAPRNTDVGDGQYFIDSLAHLPPGVAEETFIVFSRYSKAYAKSPFNLIDHARFSLGDPVATFADTLYGRPPPLPHHTAASQAAPLAPGAPLKVLMQLTGGWDLKTYPAKERRVLIRALTDLGCAVTVIDLPDAAADGATVVTAGSTVALKALLADHHVFLSVDSFPLHFASQVLGHPTVAIFGCTAPGNSDAPRRAGYRLPAPALPCGPCGCLDYCPVLMIRECTNQPRPAQLVAAILDVAAEVYGAGTGVAPGLGDAA
ncbi:glycosyltransferase family 9 protein [Nitrospirillum pindoramense]|uniref:Glycosyl transferase family 9 (Putative heptosyltransferase) n=1 Tax=Nitrospirillum amazonense TaxID=28077 RepID=A0A560HA05_9PROT|nr:glycosyltransferase family 9 protein [Nitrospirillum amazonense]TWB42454.1 glycosyl transferase family 9 (putative heptosyltransferase) [Nitrospirillum amazonense]